MRLACIGLFGHLTQLNTASSTQLLLAKASGAHLAVQACNHQVMGIFPQWIGIRGTYSPRSAL